MGEKQSSEELPSDLGYVESSRNPAEGAGWPRRVLAIASITSFFCRKPEKSMYALDENTVQGMSKLNE